MVSLKRDPKCPATSPSEEHNNRWRRNTPHANVVGEDEGGAVVGFWEAIRLEAGGWGPQDRGSPHTHPHVRTQKIGGGGPHQTEADPISPDAQPPELQS